MNPFPMAPPTPRRRQRGPQARESSWLLYCVAIAAVIGALLWGGLAYMQGIDDARLNAFVRFNGPPPQGRLSKNTSWKAVRDEHRLAIGEEIRTNTGMCTALAFDEASSVRLFIDSEVRIESYSRANHDLCLRLLRGRIWIDAEPEFGVRVLTPVGEVSVSGGVAEIRLDRGKAEVLAWRGSVRRGGASPVTLKEGRRLVTEDGRPPRVLNVTSKTDVWHRWNLRVTSEQLASEPLPSLVSAPPPAPARPVSESSSAPPSPVAVRPSAHPSLRPSHSPTVPLGPSINVPVQRAQTSVSSGKSSSSLTAVEEIVASPNDSLEKRVADMGTQQIMRSVARLSTDAALIARVDRLGSRIVAYCPRQSLPWKFRVLETDIPNAMTVGYGRVYVTRGLLELLDDEELAGAVGHEIAHACLRHTEALFDKVQEATTYARKAEEAARRAEALEAKGDTGPEFEAAVREYRENLLKAVEAVERAQSAADRWEAEYQADRNGMLYVHNAGFRPVGIIEGLEKLRKVEVEEGVAATTEGLSTHPPIAQRIDIARKVYDSYFRGK